MTQRLAPVILIASLWPSLALGNPSDLPAGLSCADVRDLHANSAVLRAMSEGQIRAALTAAGFTQAQIDAAKACLTAGRHGPRRRD